MTGHSIVRIMLLTIAVPALLLLLCQFPHSVTGYATETAAYSVHDDASWAVRSQNVKWGNAHALYTHFIDTCKEAADDPDHQCVVDESFRLDMNAHQPMSVHNYTKLGYKKIRAPEAMFKLIKEFYETNKHEQVIEWGNIINTYHNMWESPPYVILVGNESLTGGGRDLQNGVWEPSREVLEEWTGQRLSPCSLYGIRIYKNNSILTPHVDRFPLVASAIINVDQDVDEPWPLEVYGHDGIARNVTMEPGDMILYESHSIVHGRPFPLKGKYFANIFVHFEPVAPLDGSPPVRIEDLPPYLIKGSPWEKQWRKDNPQGWHLELLDPHDAARLGDVYALENLALTDPNMLHTPDANGWHPIHESVRSGHLEVVQLLLDQGADPNERTNYGEGYSLLRLAIDYLGEDHEITQMLTSMGAVDAGPEL